MAFIIRGRASAKVNILIIHRFCLRGDTSRFNSARTLIIVALRRAGLFRLFVERSLEAGPRIMEFLRFLEIVQKLHLNNNRARSIMQASERKLLHIRRLSRRVFDPSFFDGKAGSQWRRKRYLSVRADFPENNFPNTIDRR
mgnify:CR=1 FL=1